MLASVCTLAVPVVSVGVPCGRIGTIAPHCRADFAQPQLRARVFFRDSDMSAVWERLALPSLPATCVSVNGFLDRSPWVRGDTCVWFGTVVRLRSPEVGLDTVLHSEGPVSPHPCQGGGYQTCILVENDMSLFFHLS